MTSKVRVGIYGAAGYAGQDLVEILRFHPHVEIVFATSTTSAGAAVPGTFLYYKPHDAVNPGDVDVVFLALPHTASATVAAEAEVAGARVVDLSADFRFDDAES
ncbi:MAG: N-acetyl-gamma-glutamyl-phosphate reductase, partial [Chloroflexota bacterium]